MRRLVFLFIFSLFLCQLESKQPLVLPFVLHGEYIFIKAAINGYQDLDFIFDSGASGIVINDGLGEKLRLSRSKTTMVIGTGGSQKVLSYGGNTVEIGSLVLSGFDLVAYSLHEIGWRIGKRIDGIIGVPVLRNRVVYIDYEKKELAFQKEIEETPLPPYKKINLTGSYYGIPSIEATLMFKNGEQVSGKFLLDTGASITVIVNASFAKKYQIKKKLSRYYRYSLFGLKGKYNTVIIGRLKGIKMGDFFLEEAPVYCTKAKLGVFGIDEYAGFIGNSILKKFNAIFDLNNSTLYLAANTLYDERFRVDCSGIRLGLVGTAIKVMEIIPGSPASSSSIRVADTIVSVNGKTIEPEDFIFLVDLLSQPGKVVSLRIRQRGIMKLVRLHLREQI